LCGRTRSPIFNGFSMIDSNDQQGVGRQMTTRCLIFVHSSTEDLNGKGKIRYFYCQAGDLRF
jgi:hypothetical protein